MLITSLLAAGAVATFQVAITPAHRNGEAWWKSRHEQCVETTKKGGYDLIFIGDSITQGWEGGGKSTWDTYYAHRNAANFGFSGDRTEHVLWRMENGEIKGLQPKVAVIMIGTNNIGHGSSNAEQTAEGVQLIVKNLRSMMPKTKILLLGIFPRGRDANDSMRRAVARATSLYSPIADDKSVFFLDISKHFMSRDGDMWMTMMPDALHPNSVGYGIWAKAMEPKLKELLGEK